MKTLLCVHDDGGLVVVKVYHKRWGAGGAADAPDLRRYERQLADIRCEPLARALARGARGTLPWKEYAPRHATTRPPLHRTTLIPHPPLHAQRAARGGALLPRMAVSEMRGDAACRLPAAPTRALGPPHKAQHAPVYERCRKGSRSACCG